MLCVIQICKYTNCYTTRARARSRPLTSMQQLNALKKEYLFEATDIFHWIGSMSAKIKISLYRERAHTFALCGWRPFRPSLRAPGINYCHFWKLFHVTRSEREREGKVIHPSMVAASLRQTKQHKLFTFFYKYNFEHLAMIQAIWMTLADGFARIHSRVRALFSFVNDFKALATLFSARDANWVVRVTTCVARCVCCVRVTSPYLVVRRAAPPLMSQKECSSSGSKEISR